MKTLFLMPTINAIIGAGCAICAWHSWAHSTAIWMFPQLLFFAVANLLVAVPLGVYMCRKGLMLAILFAWCLSAAASPCRADYVIALHWPPEKCVPCREMLPVEAQLRKEGYDIRTVDILAHPEFDKGYPGRGVPRYAYVLERGGKSYDSGARLNGLVTAGQLRRFCIAPVLTATGAAVLGAVGAVVKPIVKAVQP